jgi:hypothetical protein
LREIPKRLREIPVLPANGLISAASKTSGNSRSKEFPVISYF